MPKQLPSAPMAAIVGTEVIPLSVHYLSMQRIGLSQRPGVCVCVRSTCPCSLGVSKMHACLWSVCGHSHYVWL